MGEPTESHNRLADGTRRAVPEKLIPSQELFGLFEGARRILEELPGGGDRIVEQENIPQHQGEAWNIMFQGWGESVLWNRKMFHSRENDLI